MVPLASDPTKIEGTGNLRELMKSTRRETHEMITATLVFGPPLQECPTDPKLTPPIGLVPKEEGIPSAQPSRDGFGQQVAHQPYCIVAEMPWRQLLTV